MPLQYQALKVRIYATIDGVDYYDVVQFSSTFELNGIPHASIMVAVGRDVTDNLEPATIHSKINELKIQVPAEVYLEIEEVGNEGVSDDLGPAMVDAKYGGRGSGAKIFEGYAIGFGWRRSQGGAQFTFHLQHWLADLHYSSALSGMSHPGNPGDWSYAATHPLVQLQPGAGGAVGQTPTWVPVAAGHRAITAGMLTGDFWGQVLKPWMVALASTTDPIDKRLLGGGKAGGGGNAAALAALERMRSSPALKMDLAGADGNTIGDGIRGALAAETWEAWANTTLWGKLIGEWAPSYWFSIAPRVEEALVVPFCGGLQGDPFKEITRSDYTQCEIMCPMRQVLRAVGLVHPTQYNAGGHMNMGQHQSDRSGLAALYQPDKEIDGLIMLKQAPPWLRDSAQAYNYSRVTQGKAGTKEKGTAFDPKGTGVGPDDEPSGREPAKIEKDYKRVMERMAWHWYVTESLKGRTGELSGKMRFDICPGSQVKIIMPKDQFIENDRLGDTLRATVLRVTTLINAEVQRAGTAFALAHVRTEAENQDPKTSVPRPPLYSEKWLGDKLVDGFNQ